MEALLKVENLTKRFDWVVANNAISFDIKRGEIHCLLGENGAGKSTLAECIYGYYQPDQGNIYFDGKKIDYRSPADAIKSGIGMVHQHFILVPPASVIENVVVGTAGAPYLLDFKGTEKKLKKLCQNYDVELDPHAKIWDLSVGQQQWVEILKALYLDAKLLILDEPTAVLTPQESEKLFKILRKMTAEGISIILITHKLNEVMQSDRVTVLRKGKLIETVITKDFSKNELTNLMVGREVIFDIKKNEIPIGTPMLEIESLCLRNEWNPHVLDNISFTVHQNEIIGIAGVAGNGQKELFEVLVGAISPESGKVFLDGEDITNLNPADIIKRGVGHIPQDRYLEGLIDEFSIADNLILGSQHDICFKKGPFLDRKKIDAYAKKCAADYEILAPSTNTVVSHLSGGNAQKVILARELWQSSKVLLANRPTRGLDVGVIEYVHQQLLKKRSEGYAIVLISEELEDLFNLADRIIVMYKGKIMGNFKTEDAKIEEIGLLMAGK
jgi:general nucleoside transport system ATP-binding protein